MTANYRLFTTPVLVLIALSLMGIFGLVAFAYGHFSSRGIILFAAYPWFIFAIACIIRLKYSWDDAKIIYGLSLAAALALWEYARTDVDRLANQSAFTAASLTASVIIMLIAVCADAKIRTSLVAIGVGLAGSFFYSQGLLGEIDSKFDHSTAHFAQTHVIGKIAASPVKYGAHNMLELDSWELAPGLYTKVVVPYSIWKSANVGDSVCAEVHEGALHATWYQFKSCS